MDFGPGTYLLGFAAGVLSTLSPCVLPLLPILIATALARHRFGPLALAAGLTLSFVAVGLFFATLGASIGWDPAQLRQVAAGLLMVFGALLLAPPLQDRLALATARMGGWGERVLSRSSAHGWVGQLSVGLVLGVVWTPCVGPTLGAATTLAAQGSHLGQIAVLMLIFGLGAGAPLVLIGMLSRRATPRIRHALATTGRHGKWLLGAILLTVGALILSGWDKGLETWALDHSPDWLTRLTTRY